jgi:glutamyl-tRNA synthetase
VAVLLRDRVRTLAEMADAAHYFYATPHPSPDRVAEHLNDHNRPAVKGIADAFADLPWTREAIAQRLKSEAAKHGLKPPQLMMPLRMLVAGTTQTPSLDAVLALLPREAVRSRIAAGLQV